MLRPSRIDFLFLLLLAAAAPAFPGVAVEEVAPASPGEQAGIRPGDVILSWCRVAPGSAPGCSAPRAIDSPFDFADLESEETPRGGVRLLGRHGEEKAEWDLPAGSSRLTVRPVLAETLLALYRQAESPRSGPPEGAVERWHAAATAASDDRLAVWFLVRGARALATANRGQEADALYAEAIGRAEKTVGPRIAASLLLERGDSAQGRGDPARAEEGYRRAESILAAADDLSLAHAAALSKLAIVAMGYREIDQAEGYLRRSLALQEKLDPDGLSVAGSLHRLGIVEMARDDDPAAVRYLERALALYAARAPDSLAASNTLTELAKPARHRRQFATAESYYRRALAIREKAAPESVSLINCLISLGNLAAERGRLAEAESYLRRAWAIADRVFPQSPTAALVLLDLGQLRGRRGFKRQAADLICQAEDYAERRRGTLGGTDLARAWLSVTTRGYYHECLAARVEAGQPAEAFRILELGRARAFLEQLAVRDLSPTALSWETAGRRQALDADYDETQARLARLTPGRDDEEMERLSGRLQEIYDQQQELAAKARETRERPGPGRDLRPLDLAAARRTLDPGTVLLAYSVGDTTSVLFVVQPAEKGRRGFTARKIPIGEKALRAAVRTYRGLLESDGSDRRLLAQRGRKLYDLLLRPAERQIAAARRLLLSPDGPLHTLPFAALVHDRTFLAEWKPVHSVLSATVYREIQKSRRPASPISEGDLVAFGDPSYPELSPKLSENRAGAPEAPPEVLTAVRRGLSLAPLPSSRQEVLDIAALYPHARAFLGAEATEEQVKALAPRARLLHFACHGVLDPRFPLNSALALSIPEHPVPGRDNGLLQAWEIFESLRLDADLVTLSACDSGLGTEIGGEGMMGLSRAFQYAGARSVLASLWSVADDSTAELMRRFYGYLRRGESKDEALRKAQVDLLHGPEATSHPYHWAAFELTGDWR